MVIRRRGNKTKLADNISAYFPKHSIYFEPFFGAGGMFFNLNPKAQYNYLNDLDNEIFNLFEVMREEPQRLYDLLELMPLHNGLFKKILKDKRTNKQLGNITKAANFLYLSNYSLYGSGETLVFRTGNSKQILLTKYKQTIDMLLKGNIFFNNINATDFIKTWSFRTDKDASDTFIYCDPPYINTGNRYSTAKWTLNNLTDLVDTMNSRNLRYAISEFSTPITMDFAKNNDLSIIEIGERRNIKSVATEILMVNYQTTNELSLWN